jgi:CubicO group peptidase (beta-lactamase class C family)
MQVRHLLDMRTGFLAQGSDASPESILNRAYLHPYHAEVIIAEYPLTHAPGERYDYSNATSELVAPLIERATGRRYAEWIGQEVLAPIGARGGQVWVNRSGGTAHAGCCLLLPAESFLRLALLSLFDGRWEGRQLLPEGFIAETRRVTPQNPWAGMGLYLAEPYARLRGAANPDRPELNRTLHSEPYLAADLYLFDGNANQVAYIVPSQELVILRVGNAPPADLGWDNSYLPNTILRGIDRDVGAGPGGAERNAVEASSDQHVADRALDPVLVQALPRNCSRIAGFSSVEVSWVISSPRAIERKSRRMILPERVLGRLSAKRISSGLASAPTSSATHRRNSSASAVASGPSGRSPRRTT